QNVYMSTNAVGLAIFDATGSIAAECGNLDMDVVADNALRVISNADSLLASFAGGSNEPFSLWLNGSRGNVVFTPVSKNLFLVIFYPKDVDIFCIRDSIIKSVSDVRTVLTELEPYSKE
ncbi:MAG: hypothetical protein WCQ53_05570, partial [bacterium]